MCFHFDTVGMALSHMIKNGWKDLYDGYWESKDGSCLAIICFLPNPGVAQVRAWEKGSE